MRRVGPEVDMVNTYVFLVEDIWAARRLLRTRRRFHFRLQHQGGGWCCLHVLVARPFPGLIAVSR